MGIYGFTLKRDSWAKAKAFGCIFGVRYVQDTRQSRSSVNLHDGIDAVKPANYVIL